MAIVRVPIHRTSPTQTVQVEAGATAGAVFGVNLKWPDGRLVKTSDFTTSVPSGDSSINTTDDLSEGQWNLWFTNRRAQDAVGMILADSANVTLRYVVGTSVTADLTMPGNTGSGTLQAVTFDAYGRATGHRPATTTDLAEGENLYFTPKRVLDAQLNGLSTEVNSVITPTDTVLSALGKLQAQIIGHDGMYDGYIDGLKMVWNSATSISVTSGAAFIPSPHRIIPSLSMLTLSELALSASTWYHVYIYSSNGTPAIECVTTVPAAPYYGTARAKTGDTSRRYLGSVLTDASGKILQFTQSGNYIGYLGNTNQSPYFVVINGKATTRTTISFAGIIPITSTVINGFMQNADGAYSVYLSVPSLETLNSESFEYRAAPKLVSVLPTTYGLDSSQSLDYIFIGGSPSGGFYAGVVGYYYER